jgi:hypothetical protein
MSFQNYENFSNKQGQQDAGAAGSGAPQQQDSTMGGQIPDNSAAQFQGGNGGDLVPVGGQQPGGDAKTTLWYEIVNFEGFFFIRTDQVLREHLSRKETH